MPLAKRSRRMLAYRMGCVSLRLGGPNSPRAPARLARLPGRRPGRQGCCNTLLAGSRVQQLLDS